MTKNGYQNTFFSNIKINFVPCVFWALRVAPIRAIFSLFHFAKVEWRNLQEQGLRGPHNETDRTQTSKYSEKFNIIGPNALLLCTAGFQQNYQHVTLQQATYWFP